MKQNMGIADRIIRILAAVAILILFLTHVITGALAVFLLVIAGIMLLTGIAGICPLYLPLGICTRCKKSKAA